MWKVMLPVLAGLVVASAVIWMFWNDASECTEGKQCDAWVQNQDLAPTVLGLLGIRHEGMDGQDVWPIAAGQSPPHRDHITTGWGNHLNVRDDRHSVHLKVTGSGEPTSVYDLDQDPHEETPLTAWDPGVVDEACQRAEAVVGELPITFKEYRQRSKARSMRTYAPLRMRREEGR